MFNYAMAFIIICVIVLFLFVVDQARQEGAYETIINQSEIVIKDKEDDQKIASRPDSHVDDLLERMRDEND